MGFNNFNARPFDRTFNSMNMYPGYIASRHWRPCRHRVFTPEDQTRLSIETQSGEVLNSSQVSSAIRTRCIKVEFCYAPATLSI